jgi:hypothetical protein
MCRAGAKHITHAIIRYSMCVQKAVGLCVHANMLHARSGAHQGALHGAGWTATKEGLSLRGYVLAWYMLFFRWCRSPSPLHDPVRGDCTHALTDRLVACCAIGCCLIAL